MSATPAAIIFAPPPPGGTAEPHCPRCGYGLLHLTRAVCPECGAAFNPADGEALYTVYHGRWLVRVLRRELRREQRIWLGPFPVSFIVLGIVAFCGTLLCPPFAFVGAEVRGLTLALSAALGLELLLRLLARWRVAKAWGVPLRRVPGSWRRYFIAGVLVCLVLPPPADGPRVMVGFVADYPALAAALRDARRGQGREDTFVGFLHADCVVTMPGGGVRILTTRFRGGGTGFEYVPERSNMHFGWQYYRIIGKWYWFD